MEFRFNVEDILRDEISRVDNNLILSNWSSSTRNRVEYQQLYQMINAIGEASSFAQGLNNVITTAEKLQNSDHFLYLMKEDDDSIGKTLVVGMLKIGRKKLFLLDHNQRTKESAPLCVLDFYIHESRQRRGYGRRLFDYMLRDHNVQPGHMAVDKPSDKFLAFLQKHYGLRRQVPQINNFVIFDNFFNERPIGQEEAALTHVSRSPRAASPERNHSPSSSRRSSTSHSHSAGKPSNPARQANSMQLRQLVQRGQIIALRACGLSIRQIAKRLDVSLPTVVKWIKRSKKTGDLRDLPRRARQRVTTAEEDEAIRNAADNNSFTNAVEIRQNLQIEASITTVRRRLHQAGIQLGPPAIIKGKQTAALRASRLEEFDRLQANPDLIPSRDLQQHESQETK